MQKDRRLAPARRFRWAVLLSLVSVAAAGRGLAQQPQQPGSALPSPRLYTVSPPGGKAGTVVEVGFTGTDLDEPEQLIFSHPAIKPEPVLPPAPPAGMPKPPVSRFKVTVAPDAPLGIHDVRLVNKFGVSNPRAFVVGDLNEVLEKDPNDNDAQAQRVPLNSTVSGTIAAPTDIDYYVFAGTKGQRVVVSCLGLSIDSRLQPALELYDAAGRKLAANHRYQTNRHHFTADALADCTLPADGDYFVRVCQYTYNGGSPEHFYRLTISTAPWIDAIHPAAVEPNKTTPVTVYGRNLPGGQPDPAAVVNGRVLEKLTLPVPAPGDAPSLQRLAFSGRLDPVVARLNGFEQRLRNPVGASNPYLLTFARAPVVLDNEANDKPDAAQEIPLPCEIAGRFEKKRDRDWYTFTAKAGAVYQIEAVSDRLGSATDTYLMLYNAANNQLLAELDENPDTSSIKFFTRSDDPAPYRFAVPADGKYRLLVGSHLTDTTAGPAHLYRVRITPEQPDFELAVLADDYVMPDGSCLMQGGTAAFTVIALRQDGMAGDIELTVEGLPPGVTCLPQTLGAAVTHATLVLSAAPNAAPFTGPIKVKGTATVKGAAVVKEARPASITWPVPQGQGIPALGRLDRSLVLAVRGQAPYTLAAALDKPAVVQGDKAVLTAKLTRTWPDFKNPLAGQVFDLPPNLTVDALNVAANAAEAKLNVVTNAATPPGTYNLTVRSTAQIPYNKDPKAMQKPPVNVVMYSTPVAVTVLPKAIATVAASAPNPNVKAGTDGEVVVQLTRMFNYDGPFTVHLELPPNLKGVSCADVTVPAGASQGKLVVKVAADAAAMGLPNLTVKVTGTYLGKHPTVQEGKINLNVVK